MNSKKSEPGLCHQVPGHAAGQLLRWLRPASVRRDGSRGVCGECGSCQPADQPSPGHAVTWHIPGPEGRLHGQHRARRMWGPHRAARPTCRLSQRFWESCGSLLTLGVGLVSPPSHELLSLPLVRACATTTASHALRHPKALAVGGVVPYLPQYLELARQGASRSEMYTKDNDGFAPLICFVLLVANMARIFFWCGRACVTHAPVAGCLHLAEHMMLTAPWCTSLSTALPRRPQQAARALRCHLVDTKRSDDCSSASFAASLRGKHAWPT